MTTSPRASIPPVTEETLKSVSLASIPVACLIALQVASIMPSPSAVASDLWPSRLTTTLARGMPSVPPWTSSTSSTKPSSTRGAELLCDDRLQVGVGQVHLAVGQLLEAGKGGVEGVALGGDAELLQAVGKGVAPGVLAEDDLAALLADRGGVDDLVCRALLEHAVLVDARLVGEGVLARRPPCSTAAGSR